MPTSRTTTGPDVTDDPAADAATPVPDSGRIGDGDEAAELRTGLVETLRSAGVALTPAVERAVAAVPRHLFLPGTGLAEAYADETVYTKRDTAGTSLSAASQPRIVAMMLTQLDVQPADRVLELGAGTGYNAALLAHLAGTSGRVSTVDVDDDLVTGSRAHLAAAGATEVEVIRADGALGHPDGAPYDRIIATVGAYEIPPAWLDQLAPTGRLVAPVRLAGAASRSTIFEPNEAGWVSRGSEMAVFMPLRGIGDDARTLVDLTGTGEITLQAHADNAYATDPATLAGVLHSPAHTEWTGVHFVPRESFEWLDLWLASHLPNPLMRLEVVVPDSPAAALVTPMFGTVAMATTTADGALAYLTIRPADPAPDGTRRYEVGVTEHHNAGSTASSTSRRAGYGLAEQVSDQIQDWDRRARDRSVTISIPHPDREQTTSDTDSPLTTDVVESVVLDRRSCPMTLTWN